MINNRQAGRRRGRGGQQQRSQGGNPGRGQDTGNRIDNRSRGNAAQLLEKYKTLARDSQMQGDRVNTEYYLQFADHYFRVLAETRSRFEENRIPAQGGANTYQDDETDYDDDGEPIARADQPRANDNGRDGNRNEGRNDGRGDGRTEGRNDNRNDSRNDGRNDSRANGNGQNNGYQANNQYDDERPQGRSNGNGGDGNGGGSGGGGENRQARDDRGNGNGNGNDRDRNRDDRGSGRDRNSGNGGNRPSFAQNDEEQAPERAEVAVAEDRPRRGRPRREAPVEEPAGFEADRLPPSLGISAITAPDSAEPEKKPRRRVRAAPAEAPPTA